MLKPEASPRDPEYLPRVAIAAKLLGSFGSPPGSVAEEDYVERLWDVPILWFAAAVGVALEERVYPSAPTVGDIRRIACELARMDCPVYDAGRYYEGRRATWPEFPRAWDVQIGSTRPMRKLRGSAFRQLLQGAQKALGEGK
jgi:hypothetical protein